MANTHGLCTHVDLCWVLLSPCLCRQGKFAVSAAVLLASLSTDSSSCFPLPPASQVIIKSHSWKAFTRQQIDSYLRQPSSRKSQRSGLFDLMCPLQLTACLSALPQISPLICHLLITLPPEVTQCCADLQEPGAGRGAAQAEPAGTMPWRGSEEACATSRLLGNND